jgi:hypothetical protein
VVLGNENGHAIGRPMRVVLMKHFTPDELKAQAVFSMVRRSASL